MNNHLLDDELHPTKFVDDLKAYDRWSSMIRDHFAFSLFIIPLFIPFFILSDNNLKVSDALFYLVMGLYFNKDVLGSRSVAKRFLGQIVIDIKTGQPASEIKCAIRNFTAMFWMIEGIIIFFSPNRRIGDFIAGTKVVRTDKVSFSDSVSELRTINKTRFLISLIVSVISAWMILNVIISLSPLQKLWSMLINM